MIVSRLIVLASALLCAGIASSACNRDSRFAKLAVGISKDSALSLIGVEKPERDDPYMYNGHYIEALYYPKPGAVPKTTPDRKMMPVVVVDGILVAWGWKKWDSIATANKIVTAQ
jgi:hypothetical protein